MSPEAKARRELQEMAIGQVLGTLPAHMPAHERARRIAQARRKADDPEAMQRLRDAALGTRVAMARFENPLAQAPVAPAGELPPPMRSTRQR